MGADIRANSLPPSRGEQGRPDQLFSSMVPFGTPAHAGKSGAVACRGRRFLAQLSPLFSLIQGADGGAAHCRYEHEGPTLSIPFRFLRAVALM